MSIFSNLFKKSRAQSYLPPIEEVGNFCTSNIDRFVLESVEFQRVIRKFAALVAIADINIISGGDVDNINQEKTQKLNEAFNDDPVHTGKESFIQQMVVEALNYGGVAIYMPKIEGFNALSFKVLDLPDFSAQTKFVSRLDINRYTDFFVNYKYADPLTGAQSPVNEADLHIYRDAAAITNSGGYLGLNSRFTAVQEAINQSYSANKMQTSLSQRAAFLFISKKSHPMGDLPEQRILTSTPISRDENIKRSQQFTLDNSAMMNSIVPVGNDMSVIDAQIDVSKTGVKDMKENHLATACNILGVTTSMLELGNTTFTNQQGAIKDAIENGVVPFANTVASFFTDFLKPYGFLSESGNETVYFDFQKVLEVNMAENTEDIQNVDNDNITDNISNNDNSEN